MKTEREIIREVNELAHTMLRFQGSGYIVQPDFRFYRADEGDIRSQRAWSQAVEVYELVTKTEVEDALNFVLEEGEEEDSELVRKLKAFSTLDKEEQDTLQQAIDAVVTLETIRREAKALNDKIDDSANGGERAQPPDGDDYNELYEIIGII